MIDPKKTYRTRDGREVRIYAVDGGNDFPVHGAYRHPEKGWCDCVWVQSGKFLAGSEHPRDLIEVRPRIQREVWVNVYRYRHGVWTSKVAADAHRSEDCIACVKLVIDCEEGEGL